MLPTILLRAEYASRHPRSQGRQLCVPMLGQTTIPIGCQMHHAVGARTEGYNVPWAFAILPGAAVGRGSTECTLLLWVIRMVTAVSIYLRAESVSGSTTRQSQWGRGDASDLDEVSSCDGDSICWLVDNVPCIPITRGISPCPRTTFGHQFAIL